MSLQERVYSVLIVSAAEKTNAALVSLLPESRFRPVRVVTSVNAAKRLSGDISFDFVIINSPLPDETGTRYAIDLARSSETAVLLLVRAELYGELYAKVSEHGVFVAAKPVNRPLFELSLDWMGSLRERLRQWGKKTVSIEEKMAEIRLVNRAKWLLITERGMEEPQAHRFIEKQAMDHSLSRREVAEEIIRTYT